MEFKEEIKKVDLPKQDKNYNYEHIELESSAENTENDKSENDSEIQ